MPIITKEDKELIVDNLLITKRKGHNLEMELLFKEMADEAEEVKTKNDVLSREVDNLLSALMQQWSGSAASTIQSIKKTNQNLQNTIREIRKDVDIAKHIVKALGYLDDAIDIGRRLLV